jgi:hypothetical protein
MHFLKTLFRSTAFRFLVLFIASCAASVLVFCSNGNNSAAVSTASYDRFRRVDAQITRSNIQQPNKKLIEFGWDNPRSDFVRQNITKMEKRPFSGFTMLLSVGTNIFNKKAFAESEFAGDRANLQATRFKKFTDNFIRMDTRHEEGWNWLNDADWKAALENVRQTTRTANVGKFTGIFFDTEPYGPNPWKYTAQAYGGKSYAEVAAVVRQRGRDFITVVHQEMPGAKIITLWFLRTIKKQVNDGNTLEKLDWGLVVPFFEGWMDAQKGEQFIDGNENSYFNLSAQDYVDDRAAFLSSKSLLSATNQAKFKRRVRLGHAMYLDGMVNLYRSPRYAGFYFPSDKSRLQQVEHNIYQGLKNSDEYVWVYSERMDWWKGSVPTGLEAAIKRGSDKLKLRQPLGIEVKAVADKAKVDYDRRIFIRGRVTKGGKGLYLSATVESGYKDPWNKESACSVYNVFGDFDCQLPHGWKGTLTPALANESFDPQMRDYRELAVGPGAWIEKQDFTAR